MAWNNKQPTAEEILGMKPEDLKAKLDKIDAFEAQFGSLKTLIEGQGTGINQLAETLKEMKVASPYSGNNSDPNNQNQNQNQDQNQNQNVVKMREWGEDADGAFTDRIAPIANLALDTRAAMARQSIQGEMTAKYKDWHLFSEEIDEMVKNQPLQARAQEVFWRNVYYAVKGKHADEIAKDQINKSGKFYTESANSITIQEEKKKTDVELLTDEQKKYAEKLGVPLDKYAKYAGEQRVH